MKKVLSLLLAVTMLVGCLIISTSAADTDIEFSTKGSAGQPDDLVTYEVYCDKNPGTYSACVEVLYDQNAFTLISCENGVVWKKSQYSTGPLNAVKKGKGTFRYFAECNDPNDVNSETGHMFTLTFQVLKTAVNGDHDITLSFPNNGDGWFFYVKDNPKELEYVDLSVACTQQSVISVSGSEATAPVTDKEDTADEPDDSKNSDTTKKDSTTKAPVIAYVTDDEGKLVKDENGKYETYEVKDTSKPIPQFVFDDKGEPVTDTDGNYETYYDTEDAADPADPAGDKTIDSTNAETNKGGNGSHSLSAARIILICSIVAVVAAVVIIIIVVAVSKQKKESDEPANLSETDDNSENE